MRMLALAQAWSEAGGTAVVVSSRLSPALAQRLERHGITLVPAEGEPGSEADAGHTAELAARLGAPWICVDGYHFDAAYCRRLRQAGRVLRVVDRSRPAAHADLVLNQNVDARMPPAAARGAGEAGCVQEDGCGREWLIGPRYALLRREFARWLDWERTIPRRAGKVLVTLGGSDPLNLTGTVLRWLAGLADPRLEVRAVVGGAADPRRLGWGRLPDFVEVVHDPADMSRLMVWADVAVSAAGSTTLELMYMGVAPLLVVTAPNQLRPAAWMRRHGMAYAVWTAPRLAEGPLLHELTRLLDDTSWRRRFRRRGRALVDGRGAARVVRVLQRRGPGA